MEKAMRNETMKEALKDVKVAGNNVSNNARELRDTATKAKDQVLSQVEEGGTRLLSDAKEFFTSNAPEYIRDGLATAQTQAKRALETSEKVMRRNVWYSVLGAAGLGIVLGAVMCRRK